MSSEVRLEGMVDLCILIKPMSVMRVLIILVFWCSVHGPTFVGRCSSNRRQADKLRTSSLLSSVDWRHPFTASGRYLGLSLALYVVGSLPIGQVGVGFSGCF